MLHHVALEVNPGDLAAEGRFWLAVGFRRVPAPSELGAGFDWYEREGTQIHLIATDDAPRPPARGHVAVVAPEFDDVTVRLKEAGFPPREARRYWRARRAKLLSPAGHLVELMEFPPEPGPEPQP